ncbi:MAG: histidine--tRNA ligase [Pirellulaceae bacterium]|nr:MAG: histidine--tRNA ligase [Pirellulaceae bacterium]
MADTTDKASAVRIVPRTLKGFRDYLPEQMLVREQLIETARRVYRSYGFVPIDTPALEYLEILEGKGGAESDKQMYRFQDHGGRWVGMRFDLTVPLARYVAQHLGQLDLPFKRYHIAPVWRGENTQRGRYREFLQCDFDTIGAESVAADVETALVIHDLMHALGIRQFTIRINNRMIFNGWAERWGLQQQAAAILRTLDKLGKIGPAEVERELREVVRLDERPAAELLQMVTAQGSNDELLRRLDQWGAGSPLSREGVERLRQIVDGFAAATGASLRLKIDPAIARGLDYYTGPIFETYLDELPSIGSVCSGGRYDDLAGLYCRQRLPGVGASLGLDRLLAALEELHLVEPVRTAAPVMIAFFDERYYHPYLQLATRLRQAGIGVELYAEPKKLAAQLKYADRRGFRYVIVAGTDEFQAGFCRVKDMRSGQQVDCSLADDAAQLVAFLTQALSERRPQS